MFKSTVAGLKKAVGMIDDYDLNLLVAPAKGVTDDPDRLTEVIKKVGGFRIGSYPGFTHAKGTSDPRETMRKLAPYAGGIEITARAKKGGEATLDAYEAVESVLSVGYQNTIALGFEGKGDPVTTLRAGRRLLAESLGQLDEDELEALLDSIAEGIDLEDPSDEEQTTVDPDADQDSPSDQA